MRLISSWLWDYINGSFCMHYCCTLICGMGCSRGSAYLQSQGHGKNLPSQPPTGSEERGHHSTLKRCTSVMTVGCWQCYTKETWKFVKNIYFFFHKKLNFSLPEAPGMLRFWELSLFLSWSLVLTTVRPASLNTFRLFALLNMDLCTGWHIC